MKRITTFKCPIIHLKQLRCKTLCQRYFTQVQQEETLKKIIDITLKIDYAVIYHLDDDEALARLLRIA